MSRLHLSIAALLLAVLAAGCGRSSNVAGGTGPGASPSAAASLTGSAIGSPGAGTSPAESPGGRILSSPTPQPQVASTEFPLSVRITPPCGRRGTRMEAEISTAPKAKLSVTVAYSDGKDHGQKGFFDADAAGRYTYVWVITSDAPSGQGNLLVAATDGQGGGNVGGWPFSVAEQDGC